MGKQGDTRAQAANQPAALTLGSCPSDELKHKLELQHRDVSISFFVLFCFHSWDRERQSPGLSQTGCRACITFSNYKPEPGLSKNGSLARPICGLKLAPANPQQGALTPLSVNAHMHAHTHTHTHTHQIALFTQLLWKHPTLLGGSVFPSLFHVTYYPYYYGICLLFSSGVFWDNTSECLAEVSVSLQFAAVDTRHLTLLPLSHTDSVDL